MWSFDLDYPFAHENLDRRLGQILDGEAGADSANLGIIGLNDKWPLLVLCDIEDPSDSTTSLVSPMPVE